MTSALRRDRCTRPLRADTRQNDQSGVVCSPLMMIMPARFRFLAISSPRPSLSHNRHTSGEYFTRHSMWKILNWSFKPALCLQV